MSKAFFKSMKAARVVSPPLIPEKMSSVKSAIIELVENPPLFGVRN